MFRRYSETRTTVFCLTLNKVLEIYINKGESESNVKDGKILETKSLLQSTLHFT